MFFFSFLCSLVVGAPKFDTSSYQEGVIEAGAVFNCGMNDGDCNLVKFDSSSKYLIMLLTILKPDMIKKKEKNVKNQHMHTYY